MDGFYVAKIQKLSDKRKGEEVQRQAEKAAEKVEDGKKEENEEVEQGGRKKKTKKPKGKKRVAAEDEEGDAPNVLRKKGKMSYPNAAQAQKSQKKKTNAKVTKPRRMKITGM